MAGDPSKFISECSFSVLIVSNYLLIVPGRVFLSVSDFDWIKPPMVLMLSLRTCPVLTKPVIIKR